MSSTIHHLGRRLPRIVPREMHPDPLITERFFVFGRGRQLPAFRATGVSACPHRLVFPHWSAAFVLSLVGLQLLAPSMIRGAEPSEVVAVYSSVSPAYSRVIQPGGSFKPESYAFGEGGILGGRQNDFTIDKLGFLDIARAIAPSLAAQNYLPCGTPDPTNADLLIMVYWGTTIGTDRTSSFPQYQIAQALVPPPRAALPPPPNGQGGTARASDPSTSGRAQEGVENAAVKIADDSALQQSMIISAMANRQRDRQDLENAAILGYLNKLQQVDAFNRTAFGTLRQDVIDEIEDSRYYVVLMAYDYPSLRVHKERKLLWETRFSIRQRGADFSQQLAAMAKTAARYFGRNSNGLIHQTMRSGHVDLGDLKIIGVVPDRK